MGWPEKADDLGRWLDEMFAGSWAEKFEKAAAAPLGLVPDPRRPRDKTSDAYLFAAHKVGLLFTARGLRRQADGDDAGALADLLTVLGVARQFRHKGGVVQARAARDAE